MAKYTIQVAHQLYGIQNEPQAPSADNGADSLNEIRRVFTRLCESAGLYLGDGQHLQGSVHLTADWDGISYGDYPHMVITEGPRGGIKIENA